MKRFLILLLISAMVLSGCSRKISNKDYAVTYDDIIYNLEHYIQEEIYRNNKAFVNYRGFSVAFANRKYKGSLEGFVKNIDEVLYQLGLLGPDLEDSKIQQYQSKVEYALEDIRSKVASYLELDTITTLVPNQYTLYNATYTFMEGLSKSLEKLRKNLDLIDEIIEPTRVKDSENYTELRQLKLENRMRTYYVFGYLSIMMAYDDDYTGLHSSPKEPGVYVLGADTYKVCELASRIMKNFVGFGDAYLNLETIDVDSMTEKEKEYFDMISFFKKSFDDYYRIRSQMPEDFFTSDKFMAYMYVAHQSGRFSTTMRRFEFDEARTEYDFKAFQDTFYKLCELLDNQDLQNMMFEND